MVCGKGYRAWFCVAAGVAMLVGCQAFVNDADREVYRIIGQRQMDALGERHSARIGDEKVPIGVPVSAYDFVPHPIDPGVPESFLRPPATQPAEMAGAEPAAQPATTQPAATQPGAVARTRPAATSPGLATAPSSADFEMPDVTPAAATTQPAPDARVMSLADGLAQALRTGRTYQNAKETLYLAILDLTLERHLWTPRLVGDIQAEFADFGQIRDFDAAMEAVSRVAVEQNLPYGGQVTAQIVNVLARDLRERVTSGESGQLVVDADVPLLRGAGRVAYESRYRAEREAIYAVRAFERFRREFLVQVASSYFNLLSTKQQIFNAHESVVGAEVVARFQVAQANAGRGLRVDAQLATVELRNALIDAESARAGYELQKDNFKIVLGLPTQVEIEVPPQDSLQAELDTSLPVPNVVLAEAVDVALEYRLDLVTDLDRIDDAKRGVAIARNGLLPDLNLRGSVTMSTEPDHLNSFQYNSDRMTWRGSIDLELPLDRKAERNDYRRSLVLVRRAERSYSQGQDLVRRDVRDAMRQLDLALFELRNQIISVAIADDQWNGTIFRFRNPKPQDRRAVDILDLSTARQSRLRAHDARARQQSLLWTRILELRLATGTLRVDDSGRWVESPVGE